jgi:hypothetical protein
VFIVDHVIDVQKTMKCYFFYFLFQKLLARDGWMHDHLTQDYWIWLSRQTQGYWKKYLWYFKSILNFFIKNKKTIIKKLINISVYNTSRVV